MTHLLTLIDDLTHRVIDQQTPFDDALTSLESWVANNAHTLSSSDRTDFSAALDSKSTDSDASLVESVLKLHAARLLHRFAAPGAAAPAPESGPYERARVAFVQALQHSERGIKEAQIDIAIANAHHLLGSASGNRHWLDSALSVLPELADVDLLALAEAVPPAPAPKISSWKRIGLRLMGFPFERLAQSSHDNLVAIARMQMSQIALLAHLLGITFEELRERQRARRAFYVVGQLVMRLGGLVVQEPDHLLSVAEDILHFEAKAARVLAQQVHAECASYVGEDDSDVALLDRAEAILKA